MDVLEMVRLLQPPKSEESAYKEHYEKIISFAASKVKNDVSSYTNIPIDELPERLNETIAMMASNLISGYGLINDADADEAAGIKQISEGDTSVTFADHQTRLAQAMAVTSISSDFVGMLNRERRVVF